MADNNNQNQKKQENLSTDEKLLIEDILHDLDKYRPKRKGWAWREEQGPRQVGPFNYKEVSKSLKNSVPLPAARSFQEIDPQPDCVITSEIASGRFEDDIRRMRMAAWHGADHMMVIRTAGQSHFDGLIEGTPEGVGGIPISRKQLRATRKGLDLIEEEVGRPLNLHSYVSGVSGPEIALLFAEEGVNGAHQDPQYNVLYRNVNMVRSFVDAAVAKNLMKSVDMLQIDGAHNANATAREAWKVMPELMVQHAINTAYSRRIGMPDELISLSSVPPTAPPAPALTYDLPYAVALRELFPKNNIRAQMNTKYIESDTREATVTHVLNLLISRLTRAEIQSTITPDEGRNVPWHHFSVQAVDTAKQALLGMDGLKDLVEIKRDGIVGERVRELKERAVLFFEEILETGGYFKAVEEGYFVDSGFYPERNGDGIQRDIDGGVGANTIVKRDEDYMAPVCEHFGYNNLPQEWDSPCEPVDGCTLCDHDKIAYIDELDDEDNVEKRLEKTEDYRKAEKKLIPEVEWAADRIACLTMFLPVSERVAEYAALEMVGKMGWEDAEVIHKYSMQPAEGTYVEVKGRVPHEINPSELDIPEPEELLPEDEIRDYVSENGMKVVAATVGEDEHSVGMREIIDIKHGGIEAFGIKTDYLGTSVPVEKVVDAAVEIDADAILISTIITHGDVHRENMKKLHQLCVEKGMRDKVILIGGGTQVNDDIAKESGLDAGFGRGTKGINVASYLVKQMKEDADSN
ncbi:D-ornithine 4,5-aminomutase subunit OraE [Natranaerobius thermophilus]|uniref:D-Lysine 56-aminomutase alpha subunit n=1 Tax=Natranaerobius thermophilus (strain ATCC BAA-1301 / DSM 18059 / JW/NM-WN-LF) TaxID=457570 RepID=B2A1L3_NATTJ|nr:D-ornithine 4,5-aminomutase subunit OraE [Natranaerobius thermophilus]ACB84753.1 D-Lysine 56-aminomutase alpha subunit [Natranaerobius thermophilus JW/NM-WN-LF]